MSNLTISQPKKPTEGRQLSWNAYSVCSQKKQEEKLLFYTFRSFDFWIVNGMAANSEPIVTNQTPK
jgi:hypothetical protein